jgi:rhamnogalacturonan endolyase
MGRINKDAVERFGCRQQGDDQMNRIWIFLLVLCVTASSGWAEQSVRVARQGEMYVLENQYLRAEVSRTSGDLVSVKYRGQEMMDGQRNHGYWEQNPSRAAELSDGISIDPAANGGERAEVYIRGKANGKVLAGTSSGGMVCDLEIRYSLGRNDHGIYTYAIFAHPASYPRTEIGESRFAMKLNGSVFDWMSVDALHNHLMASGYDWQHGQELNMKEARKLTTGSFTGKVEHKYDYSSDLFDNRAFGWSSTKKHVGIFLINPSMEYMSGGPTKVELTCHLGDDGPIVLDYWRSTHYGGSTLDLDAGEEWAKVVGPIFVYLNEGSTPDAIFANARQEADRQQALWPFEWVREASYAPSAQRATISGKVEIKDDFASTMQPSRLRVGLIPPGEADGSWQRDAKHYQFWTYAGADGSFSLKGVRPGKYALHALADGVFGEYSGASIVVEAGKPVGLGAVIWKPLRYGRQLWEIGIPNRNGTEFFGGDHYNQWGMYLLYAKLFPNDVEYWIGKSNFRKDWYYEQVPNAAHKSGENPMNGGDTIWKIHFNSEGNLHGVAILRTGLSGVGTRHVFVTVNGSEAGDMAPLEYNATINRDGIQGMWTEHDVRFAANLLKSGDNVLELKVPAGSVMAGVIYDYLRLELDESGH